MLVDDMIDTAGTITEAAKVVMNAGATEVLACATHPILSDPACERLNKSSLTELITTNTIPLRAKAQAELLAQGAVGREPYSGSHPPHT